jgi:hypothetical protein
VKKREEKRSPHTYFYYFLYASNFQLRENIMSELGDWLKHNALWNSKKNRATTSLFLLPPTFISDQLLQEVPAYDTPVEDPSITFVSARIEGSEEERGLTCRGCSLTFETKAHQYVHFKSELHRLNLKRKLRGLEPIRNVSESDDAAANDKDIDGNDEGSDNSSDESDNDAPRESLDEFRIEDYLDEVDDGPQRSQNGKISEAKQHSPLELHSPKGLVKRVFSHTEGPMLLFSPSQSPAWDFTVSAAAILVSCTGATATEIQGDLFCDLASTARMLQDTNTSMICVMILRSGRFAAAVFDGQTVLAHKVMRFVTS